jgi:hypothetical protein
MRSDIEKTQKEIKKTFDEALSAKAFKFDR